MLKGKTVVVGVCGGIAAYKVVDVVSKLKKHGASVHVIMTEHAGEFVTPLTFRSISHNPVVTDMFEAPQQFDVRHISLAEKADLIVVAPATANVIGKVSRGIADDMLTTTIMASKAPVLFVPAMNTNMYENRIVQENIALLKNYGYKFIEPGTGMLACGAVGKGRLPEPEDILGSIIDLLFPRKDMESVRVMVTAGPTREAIDPVRYITNHSSGKMGYSIASVAAKRGASVRLISGPVNLKRPDNVDIVNVTTAQEMYNEVISSYENFDVMIMAAAVADYRSAAISDKKLKKTKDDMVIELVKNPDIAKEVGKIKGQRVLVGFSAETNDLIDNAKGKLESKKFDMIVANDVTREGAGFNTDTNIVSIIGRDGSILELPIMSKEDVAKEILNEVIRIINQRRSK